MINTASIPRASTGVSFNFSTGNFLLTGVMGLGIPSVKVLKETYPTQHGGRMISQFYESRRIVLSGMIKSPTCEQLELDRISLVDAFTFENEEKTLTLVTTDGQSVMIEVTPASQLRLEQRVGFKKTSKWEIELEASDPLFYGATLNVETGGITTIGGGFAIPFAIPFAISGGISNQITVVNAGNSRVFPERVVLYGPGTDFILENRTLSEQLVYTGTIADGDYVEVDMKNRTALYNGLTNVYGNVSGEYWKLAIGTNTIALTVASGDGAATLARIEWYDAYLGV